MKNSSNYSEILMVIACTLAGLFTILFLCQLPFNRESMARRDYIVYWATGQQLAHHENPYDPSALNRIESGAGFRGGTSYYMRNIPWALPLALPLGYFGAMAGALPWSLAMLGLLAASVYIAWNLFGQRGSPFMWMGYCYPPALFCVILGQTSIFLLFGLVLFLRLHKSHPFAAGAALWFCTIKPHLFLPFGIVLLVWIVASRSYRILAGAIAALAGGILITACIDPAAWSQYSHYMQASGITHEFTANLGNLLRDSVNPAAEWLAFVPAILGCTWALYYYWSHRQTWDWIENGSLLVLVSLVVAPFGWIFDQSIVLPALLFGVSRTSSRILLSALSILYLTVGIEIMRFELHSAAYLWIAPAWLIWYVLAHAKFARPHCLTSMNRFETTN